jgi:FAD/FMN-containing dehydrogenase
MLDRRTLLKLAGGSIAVWSGAGRAFATAASAVNPDSAAARLAGDLPPIDGVFAFDPAICRAMATDWGKWVHRLPIGVLLPRSVADIRKIVRFAASHGLKIAMRGHGCSIYGQAQVDAGIVIDTADFNALHWAGDQQIDCQPGVIWLQALNLALARGLTPPVLPDTLFLTIGGTLSVGGMGDTSYRLGAAVDHVAELDVVTGAGELVTCSASRNADLFYAVLAGMGQCGLIVRARLRLVPAPPFVAIRTLRYPGHAQFVRDLGTFARAEPQGAIRGRLVRGPDGFRPQMTCMTWLASDREPAAPQWLELLSGTPAGDARIVSFEAFANELTGYLVDAEAREATAGPRPRVIFFVPQAAAESMLDYLASDADAALGASGIPVFPLLTRNFRAPCLRLPDGELVFQVRIYRLASAEGAEDHLRMLRINVDQVIPRVLRDGGTFYLPHTPILSSGQWEQHFGPTVFAQLKAAKKRYDPNGVLNPGAGIFQLS